MFWFFQFQFRQAYDSTYDSNFSYPLGHKLPYDSVYDSATSENQPLLHILFQLYLEMSQ